MDEYDFEGLVADIWESQGWDTTPTSNSNDRGVDVIAEKQSPFQQRMVIQAKRYSESNKVGGPEVREYASLKHQEENVDIVTIVTTSSFTQQAKQTAQNLNIKLIDGESLVNLISDEEIPLEEYNIGNGKGRKYGTAKSEKLNEISQEIEYLRYSTYSSVKDHRIKGEIFTWFNAKNKGISINRSIVSALNVIPANTYGAIFIVTTTHIYIILGKAGSGTDGNVVAVPPPGSADYVLEIDNDDVDTAEPLPSIGEDYIDLHLSRTYEIEFSEEIAGTRNDSEEFDYLKLYINKSNNDKLEEACEVIEGTR